MEAARQDGIPLGRILGIPVVLAWSWFIIAAFVVIVFGPQVADLYPTLGPGAYGVAFAYAVLLAASVLIHELAHALSARRFGWPTTRIVLNLWGGHTQFENFAASPGRSLIVALAGPAANLVLALLGWGALQLVEPTGVANLLANILIWANFLVAAFNVLPGLPLDGGRIVESAVWRATGSQEKGTVAAGWSGRIIAVGIVAAVVLVPLVAGSQPGVVTVLVAVVMGGFLWIGASSAISNARMRLRLPAVSAGRLQHPAVGVLAGTSVHQVKRLIADRPGIDVVLTGPNGLPEAVVDQGALAAVPDSQADRTPANAVARALAPGAYVPEFAEGQELVQYLARLAGSEYAVMDRQGTVTGLLHQSVVVAAITGRRHPGIN
ncbi:Zn-dependent protease (includes SpoIVFB) [Arthrobacter subterraneus]|uniref:Zinc metalloprotease n=2 Tax=Arthrobacter TaxID=1663 RepID=A0A1G8ENG2_9MICC|nr:MULTISPECIES: site-2 protease family protein [Arthrobacter]SDH71420.1 Zn-dependent protease (includes SpoIVFB) [Arthrobacter subterraneus]